MGGSGGGGGDGLQVIFKLTKDGLEKKKKKNKKKKKIKIKDTYTRIRFSFLFVCQSFTTRAPVLLPRVCRYKSELHAHSHYTQWLISKFCQFCRKYYLNVSQPLYAIIFCKLTAPQYVNLTLEIASSNVLMRQSLSLPGWSTRRISLVSYLGSHFFQSMSLLLFGVYWE